MQDLGNDVLYPFFLDVGQPFVSYIEDLAALPVYPLAYRRHQGSCQIAIPASPPGVYPVVELQDGDLRTKSSMVTRRCRDLDRFGPQ